MRLRHLLLGGIAAAVLVSTVGTQPAHATAPEDSRQGWQQTMLNAANTLRAQSGVPRLRLCAPLTRTAQDYAEVMASQNYYGHQGPDGAQPWDRMTAHGYRWRSAAENIAGGYRSVADVMRAWRESPHHLENLLDPHYTHVGFGRATAAGSLYGTYWVQDFGSGGACRTSSGR